MYASSLQYYNLKLKLEVVLSVQFESTLIRMIFENTKILLTNCYIFEFLKFQKFDVTVFSSNIANDRHTNNKF